MSIANDILSQANADFSGIGALTSYANPPADKVPASPTMMIVVGLVVVGFYFLLKGKR